MDYKDLIYSLHINRKLNEKGYSDYVGMLLSEITDLRLKIIDLETKLQYKKKKT